MKFPPGGWTRSSQNVPAKQGENHTPVVGVAAIVASSWKGFEDANEERAKRATEKLKNVGAAWVQDQKVIVKDGKVAEYRVNLKVTFILE